MANEDQVRQPTGTFKTAPSLPSRGGRPYSNEVRLGVIHRWQTGQSLVSPDLQDLRDQGVYPSQQTCRNWINQFIEYGHIDPMCHTGNHRATREVRGDDLTQLALFRTVNPKATIHEIRAFLFNLRQNEVPLYSISQICRAEKLLGLSNKVGSTTCVRAYLPINLAKRQMYFSRGEPFGILNTPIQDVLDLDEMGVKVESGNRKYGKSTTFLRVDNDGAYNRDKKHNLLMCAAGDNTLVTRSWFEMWEGEGLTIFRFYNFIERIILSLAQTYPGRSFCFTMDNLNIHHNPLVLQLITESGHRYVFRAPYWSCDGAIEYIFNTIHSFLMFEYPGLENLDDLENAIENIIETKLGLFSPYFQHVGFNE